MKRPPSFYTVGDVIECAECRQHVAWTKDPEAVVDRLIAEHECEQEDWE